MNEVKEWLAERARINGAATEGTWEIDDSELVARRSEQSADWLLGGVAEGCEGFIREHADAMAIVDAHENLPRLVSAAEKVLALHSPGECMVWWQECSDPENHEAIDDPRSGELICSNEVLGHFCIECIPDNESQIDLDEYPWPCPTVEAIREAITSEEGK